MAERNYTQQLLKQLFALSHNQCAYPECQTKIVDKGVFIGEIAHIEAINKGARYNPSLSDPNHIDNLMVLCPTHHTLIDKDEANHSVATLKEWKKNHEAKATEIDLETEKVFMNIIKDNKIEGGVVLGNKTENHYHNHNTQTPQELKNLNLWIASVTKSNIPHHDVSTHYHETDASQWKPFKDEDTISVMIQEYKEIVNFNINERYLAIQTIEDAEKSEVEKQTEKLVLVLDPFAIDFYDDLLSSFNKHQIGGCLVLVCQSVNFDLFLQIKNKLNKRLDKLFTCYIDYTDKYLHFMFPISTKEQFYRSMSNIAIEHLKVAKHIDGLERKNYNFNF